MEMDYEKIRAEARAAEIKEIRRNRVRYLSISVAVVLLVRLLAPFEKKRPGWAAAAQRNIDQVEQNWADYTL